MIRNFLLVFFAILMGSCCYGQKSSEQTYEKKGEKIGNLAPEFGEINRISIEVEVKSPMTYPKGSPVDKWGKLKVSENENGVRSLCNENGKPVQLRGVSSHGLQWAGVANLTQENIKTLSEKFKCNVFRIAVYVDEEGGYAYNLSHRNRYKNGKLDSLKNADGSWDYGHVENMVQWCGENGIYCLIDWHIHKPGNPQHWKYRNRKYPEEVEGSDLAADFFTYCARRFQHQKHVLYELCNEPNKKEDDKIIKEITWINDVKPYCEDMLKIVRSYDEDVIVICGSPEWSKNLEEIVGNEPQNENGEKYNNVMYTYHFYAATHNNEGGKNHMTRFKKMSAELPIFVTEWGTTHADGRRDFNPELSNQWLGILNGDNEGKQVISWINWSFSAEGGLSAILKWNTGSVGSQFPEILTESGKYIYEQLKKGEK